MKNQEGYIKLDGELVSQAAKKAFDHFEVIDAENALKVEEKNAELDKQWREADSYFKGQAKEDFKRAKEMFSVNREYTRKRWA